MSVELPAGWSAWTKDGAPARRVITMGRTDGQAAVAIALGGLPSDVRTSYELDAHIEQLWSDAVIWGDAYVDLACHRVDPGDIVLEPPHDA